MDGQKLLLIFLQRQWTLLAIFLKRQKVSKLNIEFILDIFVNNKRIHPKDCVMLVPLARRKPPVLNAQQRAEMGRVIYLIASMPQQHSHTFRRKLVSRWRILITDNPEIAKVVCQLRAILSLRQQGSVPDQPRAGDEKRCCLRGARATHGAMLQCALFPCAYFTHWHQ
jgi:hypothetical protein